jgi:hypothetical protein
MRFSDYARQLIELSRTVLTWVVEARDLDRGRREKVALYAEEIAATLARAASALAALERQPEDSETLLVATRELGRIAGYVETILTALETHLDGRRRAGLKRRLESLEPFELEAAIADAGAFRHARRLASAEGFFRALADALRT